MITRSPISTISYNSFDFLLKQLCGLVNEHVIEFWCFIEHLPEDDETKAHKHLFVIPSSNIDTFALRNRMLEVDVKNPDNPPLGCINWRKSKFIDWYLYVLHDVDYLVSKGESRRFHYNKNELVCSDTDYLVELIHMCDFSPYKKFSQFRDCVNSGVPFEDLVRRGFVPIPQIYQWSRCYTIMKFEGTNRGGRPNHEEGLAFNEDGELVDY